MEMIIRTLRTEDVDLLTDAFAGWPKPRELFEGYAERVQAGDIDMLVAVADSRLVGYLLIVAVSPYPPFATAHIPEIADFNVLPDHRRQGIGTALMDEAEHRAAQRSDTVGLGVGLYSDYGNAQRLYVRRGYLPDGAGAIRHNTPVPAAANVDLNDHLDSNSPNNSAER